MSCHKDKLSVTNWPNLVGATRSIPKLTQRHGCPVGMRDGARQNVTRSAYLIIKYYNASDMMRDPVTSIVAPPARCLSSTRKYIHNFHAHMLGFI